MAYRCCYGNCLRFSPLILGGGSALYRICPADLTLPLSQANTMVASSNRYFVQAMVDFLACLRFAPFLLGVGSSSLCLADLILPVCPNAGPVWRRAGPPGPVPFLLSVAFCPF